MSLATGNVGANKVAKKLGRPPKSERDDASVKVSRSIVAMGKVVAGHKNVPLAELLSDLLQAPMKEAYLAMVRDLEKRPKSS